MTTPRSRLEAAIADNNRAALEGLEVEHGLTYLGNDPLVHLAGTIRIAGLFSDPQGTIHADLGLVAESLHHQADEADFPLREFVTSVVDEAAHHADLGVLLEVFALHRGLHTALIAPVAVVADHLDLPRPELAGLGYARTWWVLPTLCDQEESHLYDTGFSARPEM